MSEERERYEQLKDRASLSGWADDARDELSRHRKEATAEYIDKFSPYGPADLMALLETSEQRLEHHRSLWAELDEGSDLKGQVRIAYHRERGRRQAIQSLLDGHLLHGPSFELNHIGSIDDLADEMRAARSNLPEKTTRYLEVAARVARGAMSVSEIVREVAAHKQVSESTAYKWLCDRNPRYKANAPEDERLTSLLDLIDEVATSREVA